MSYLNWKALPQDQLEQSLVPHHEKEFLLTLTISMARVQELLPMLTPIFASGSQAHDELRVDLPQDWIIFFKTRDSDSRLLMAHPQPNEWVAMLAFEPEHGKKLMAALASKKAGEMMLLSEIGELGSVSNLEVKIIIK